MKETKICNKCKLPKELKDFGKDKKQKDQLKLKCRQCVKQYDKKYNNLNKTKIKQYYLDNKKKINKHSKLYYINNKENILINCKKWKKQNINKIKIYDKTFRIKNKIFFSIKNSINCRIWASLKNKSKKHLRTEKYLGCSIEECKQHLEQMFRPEMNWSNHGKVWEIDHIKPCSKFNLININQQKQCFHYTNLQPLFKTTKIAESFGYKNEIGNRNKNNYYEQKIK